ncbi:MAG TPA: hypothetical protein VJ717_01670 [Gemmatimonadaceae bacterium]|nr:hypothetical protein [Gemmatimonadaceae bacterium]
MTRGLILAVGSAALALMAIALGQRYLTMSAGMVAATVVLAGAVGALVGWFLRFFAEGDRLAAMERKWKDRLAALQSELGHMTSRASAAAAEARAKDDQIIERDRSIANFTIETGKIDTLHGILRDKDRLINDLDERISGLTIALDDRTTALGQRDAELAAAADRQSALERELATAKATIDGMVPKTALESVAAKHSELQTNNSEELAKLKRQLATRDQSLKDAAAKIATLEARAAEVPALRAKLAEADVQATQVAHRIEELEREVAARIPEADYHEAKTQIAALRGATSKLADVEIQLLSTGEQATELSERVRELEARLKDMVPRAEYEALSENLRSLAGRTQGNADAPGAH